MKRHKQHIDFAKWTEHGPQDGPKCLRASFADVKDKHDRRKHFLGTKGFLRKAKIRISNETESGFDISGESCLKFMSWLHINNNELVEKLARNGSSLASNYMPDAEEPPTKKKLAKSNAPVSIETFFTEEHQWQDYLFNRDGFRLKNIKGKPSGNGRAS